ncbi:MAG: IS200/IS605 family transposase [Solitalea-like symbiont of Acarus siro]
MQVKRWNTSRHAVFKCQYHFIWCPKYRRKVLVDGVDTRLKELIFEKATKNGWIIHALEVMPDHVHVFAEATVDDSPAFIVSQLKGYSAFVLRNEFPFLKSRLPSLWTRSYFCSSVGHISGSTVKQYIENQKRS